MDLQQWQGRLFWDILNRGLDDDRLRGFENFVIKWIIIIKVILSIKSDFLFSKLLDHWLDVPVLRYRQEKVMHFLTGLDFPLEPPSPRPCQLGIEAAIFHLTSWSASWETRLSRRWTELRPGQSSGQLYEIKRNYFLFYFEIICYGLCYHNKRTYIWNYTNYKSKLYGCHWSIGF